MTETADLYAVVTADFDARVIGESRARPVLVDFWAPWCGPCRAVAPLLEELATRFAGRLAVAKVDTDAEPDIAYRFGVRSLPTLMVFRDGAPVDQALGAQPLAALEALVAPYVARRSDALVAEAGAALAAGDAAGARATLARALADDPQNWRIHPVLAALLIDAGELDQAQEVLRALPANEQTEASEREAGRLHFARIVAAAPPLADLEAALAAGRADSASRYQWAIRKLMAGEHEPALAALIDLVRSDRRYGEDAARKATLEAFRLLGDDHPLVRQYRTQLARALH